jgi:1-acyl-sn-glycerol-3-phosphate acyltransferase
VRYIVKAMGKFLFFIIKLFGWKIDPKVPEGVDKAVIVVGPHTSNWDFIIGKIAFMKYGIPGQFLIKKELFFFPFGYLLKKMGGLPVDRTKNNRLTDYAVELFDKHERFYLVFTPEGTRSYNPNWKKGFYYIAQKANVPIYIAYIDFSKKIGGFHSLFEPTGDVEADIQSIKNILKQYKGRFPENGID